MKIRRISVGILRFLLCLVGLWLLLAILWVAIPSDMPTDTDNSNALRRGDTVSQVYNPNTFYPWTDPTPDVRRVSRTLSHYLILDVKLERTTEANSSYSMVLGAPPDSIAFKLGRGYGAYPMPPQTIPLVIPDETADVNVSSPLTFTSRTSGDCGVHPINWINRADVAITCWWLQHDWLGLWRPWLRYALATTPMRIRTVPANRTIELWPESYHWQRPDSPWNPPEMGPFLTIKLHGSSQTPVFTFHPASISPSKLFTFRMVLLAPLAFIPLVFFIVVSLIVTGVDTVLRWLFILAIFLVRLATAMVGCIGLLAIFWWFKAGRPHVPLREFVEAIRNVINDNARRGRIALPDDNDLEAQEEPVTVSEGVTGPTSSEQTVR